MITPYTKNRRFDGIFKAIKTKENNKVIDIKMALIVNLMINNAINYNDIVFVFSKGAAISAWASQIWMKHDFMLFRFFILIILFFLFA